MATVAGLIPVALVVFLICSTAAPFRISRGCKLATSTAEEYLPTIRHSEGTVIPERDSETGRWTFDLSDIAGEEFRVQCQGRGNHFRDFSKKVRSIVGLCDGKGYVVTEHGPLNMDALACLGRAVSSATRNGTCAGLLTKIDVKIGSRLFYEVCHDETRSETYYSKSTIDGPRLDESVSISRPPFAEADFYADMDANKCYTQVEQTITIEQIVGENSYIQTSKNLFLARGHMMPNADGITADEKISTFYFINASPQWQTINGGNWERLETSLRGYAEENQRVLTVWTGALGVGVLKDNNGVSKEIYLGKTSDGRLLEKLPVPRLLWKAVVDPGRNVGAVVVAVHNPYPEHHEDSDFLCEDVCEDISWVTWDTEDAKSGLTYCCTVDSFRSHVPNIPLPSGLGIMK